MEDLEIGTVGKYANIAETITGKNTTIGEMCEILGVHEQLLNDILDEADVEWVKLDSAWMLNGVLLEILTWLDKHDHWSCHQDLANNQTNIQC